MSAKILFSWTNGGSVQGKILKIFLTKRDTVVKELKSNVAF